MAQLLKQDSAARSVCSKRLCRALHVVRCTATANPSASGLHTPAGNYPNGAAVASQGQPGNGSMRRAPSAPQGGGYGASTSAGAWTPRAAGEQQQQLGGGGREPRGRERQREVYFLEDDEDQVQRRAKAMYAVCTARDKGVVVRSLGRQGDVGAINFVLALRAAGQAGLEKRDVRFRMYPQEPLSGFGTPLMLFVEPVAGRVQLPEGDRMRTFSVASRYSSMELEANVLRLLSGLAPGQYARLEMVGSYNIHRGLQALASARAGMGRQGGSFLVVPDLVCEQVRSRAAARGAQARPAAEAEATPEAEAAAAPAAPQGEGEAPSGGVQQPEGAAATSAVTQPEAAVSESSAAEAASASVTAEAETEASPVMVDVLRLYITRAPSRTESTSAAGAQRPQTVPVAAAAAAAPAATSAAAAATGVPPVAAGEGQIVVSRAEWESLRGALGSMMDQQKLLAQLLEQQRKGPGAAEGSQPPAGPAV